MTPIHDPRQAHEPRVPAPRGLHKGQQTRAAILDAARASPRTWAWRACPSARLAGVTQMRKSGVSPIWPRKLDISVIRETTPRFEEEVFFPAMGSPCGLPRRRLLERWTASGLRRTRSGCIDISWCGEFDDRPGRCASALAEMVRAWHSALARATAWRLPKEICVWTPTPTQMLFELHGLTLALAPRRPLSAHPGARAGVRAGFERTPAAHYRRRASAMLA